MAVETIDPEANVSILTVLRARTRDVHQRLHNHPLTRNLVRRSLSTSEYLLILHALYHYYSMVESELKHLPFVYPQRQSSHRLQRDYHKISGELSNPLIPCPALNLDSSVDSALGLLYVLEGSRQGGNIIARNVKKTLGLGESNGAAFYAGDTTTASADWDDFVQLLNDQCSDTQTCSLAALKSFLLLENYLWMIHKNLQPDVAQLQSV